MLCVQVCWWNIQSSSRTVNTDILNTRVQSWWTVIPGLKQSTDWRLRRRDWVWRKDNWRLTIEHWNWRRSAACLSRVTISHDYWSRRLEFYKKYDFGTIWPSATIYQHTKFHAAICIGERDTAKTKSKMAAATIFNFRKCGSLGHSDPRMTSIQLLTKFGANRSIVHVFVSVHKILILTHSTKTILQLCFCGYPLVI